MLLLESAQANVGLDGVKLKQQQAHADLTIYVVDDMA